MMDITRLFLSEAEKYEQFYEAIDIIQTNSNGKFWLIGGFLYKNLAHILHGSPMPKVDLDFIVEKTVKDYVLPKGWGIQYNRFGNPKFSCGEKEIDYVLLDTAYSINFNKLKPTIENFLKDVPLTIQAIAYDVTASKMIGEIGLNALHRGVVEINDRYFAEYAAKKKGITVNEMIRKKAEEINFKGVYI